MDACCGYPLKLEFLNADNSYLLSNETCKENSVLIRFKGGELCRRFSLKLERNAKREAFETLVSKLRRYGYEANGRTLVAIECDGTRTVIDDSESLWNVLEGCGFITATNASLELEYFKSGDLIDFDYSKEKICPESGAGGRKSQATLIGSQISSTRSDAISSDSESFSRISRPDSALEQTVFDNDIALQQIEVDGATLDRCGKIENRLEKLEKKVDELAAKMARLCHQ
ncbi:unnamed protein product [Toxocara canis]|uniref:PB1 domain-containing protein n=1 Tax=Toxocara canis TaxID=6265 RepID=A0A183U8C7_TOXCA|nr:unnamed protein product [Toxocara canis]